MGLGATDSALPKDLDRLWRVGVVGGLTDRELLDRFLCGSRGADEAAFTVLAERHGPMVLRVCRQILGDTDEAQDAFQATFLVFVRRANAIRKRESVASWLHGVASRVSRRAKVDAARRRKHERLGAEKAMETRDGEGRPESWPELHDAIARLPQRYREPTVLCYLEGMTTEAAALRIGCPQGTILSRLARARERLRTTLSRQGVAVPAGLLTTGLVVDSAPAAVPASLLVATVQASLMFAGRQTATASLASSAAAVLARGVLSTMTISKIKLFCAVALAGLFALGGAQTFGQFGGMGGRGRTLSRSNKVGNTRAELAKAVAKLQADLNESNERNRALQKELQEIQDKLKAGLSSKDEEPVAPKPEAIKEDGEAASEFKAEGAPNLGKDEKAVPPKVRYYRQGDTLFIHSPQGDKLTIYQMLSKKSQSIRLAPPRTSLEVAPIVGPGAAALMIRGPRIIRIAAAASANGPWIPMDLREPVEGEAMPIVGPGVVAYGLGRYIYAFSSLAHRWDVAELPEGVVAPSPIVGPGSVTVEGGGHVFTFGIQAGKWSHVDVDAVVDEVVKEDSEDSAPQK